MTAIERCPLKSDETTLTGCIAPELRRLTVQETATHVTVAGLVTSYYLKSMALEAAKQVARGRTVVIRVEVVD